MEWDGMKWRYIPFILVLLPLVVVVAIVAIVAFAVSSVCLHILIWTWWGLRGRDVLFVYSDSPVWRDYIEQHILPFLGDRAVVLNWSQRRQWRLTLARLAFHHFGGSREFNPLAVVFRPLRLTKTFRFWKPFREYKHGRPLALRTLEDEFYSVIGVRRPESPV
jgi:hypothetical protein